MAQKSNHLFYVLECKDGSYYGGYTTDLDRRVAMHNTGKGAKYTRSRSPVRCIHHETFETKREAMQAEYRFKQLTRPAKERYLKQEEATE
ncbi:GIY-YIG nuclease family protein [Sporosarcina sp. A2]|uniref:GIY-YIG nuclease family protein n=1 Tax=Sporosarcina sp. A2 TaxID=3393449 RepID=UPI003D7BBF4E